MSANGHTGEIKALAVKTLQYDPRVQREVRPGWVEDLATSFKPDKVGIIHVSARDDGFMSVIDGWHRVLAYRALGRDDDKVFCQIHRGLTVAEEAETFLDLNNRKAVNPLDKFRVAVIAGDPEAVAINNIVESLGLCVGTNGDGQIAAVNALRSVYGGARIVSKRENPDALRNTLRTIMAAWGKQRAALESNIIQGTGYLILRYGSTIDRDDLSQKLAPHPGGPAALVGIAKAVKAMKQATLPHCVAAVMTDIYNKGRRSKKLPDWWSA